MQRLAPRVVDHYARFVLTETLGARVDVAFENVDQGLLATGKTRPGIDAAKWNQPVAVWLRFGQDEICRQQVARRFGRNQRQDDRLLDLVGIHPRQKLLGLKRRRGVPRLAEMGMDVDIPTARAVVRGLLRERRYIAKGQRGDCSGGDRAAETASRLPVLSIHLACSRCSR
jgi:hypothetical protein